MTIAYENLTARAAKAFGCYSGSKAVMNLPTEAQIALLNLETFLQLFGRIARIDAPVSARAGAVAALRHLI